MLIKFTYDFFNFFQRSITPTTLMISKTPERRDVADTDIVMVLLQKFFRISLTKNDDEVNISANRIIDEIITIFRRLNKQTMCIFKVNDVIQLAYSFSSKIDGMVPISLLTNSSDSIVHHPRFISVPNSPQSICYLKSILKAFS